jgi:RNA polymerase sigma-70 factor (ECF subfamily)
VTTDEDLMHAVRAGDRDAFASLFERYQAAIWRFFRRRLSDRGVAEELTQDTFLAVLQNAARYEPRAPFRSYLFGIAFNLLSGARRDYARHGGARPHAPSTEHPAPSTPDQDAVLWVRQALAGLDADDREILMLREYDALGYDEIAAVLGVPIGTVRSRLFRARLALKDRLEARPEPQEAAQ